MTVRILRWATGCVAAVSVALLVGGVALSYVDRHMGPLSRWDFSNVFEEATFMAVPAVGFVLASRRESQDRPHAAVRGTQNWLIRAPSPPAPAAQPGVQSRQGTR
jgi:hypothetical protein